MHRIAVATIAAVLACSPPSKPQQTGPGDVATVADDAAPGDAAIHRLQYKLTAKLIPEKAQLMVGEPMFVRHVLENGSARAIQFVEGGNQRNRLGRYDSYQLVATDANGKSLPVIDSSPNFGGIGHAPKVEPGGTFDHALFLPNWVELTGPGTYTLTSTRTYVARPYGDDRWFGEQGDKVVVVATTKVRVVPTDDAKMRALIESLGPKLMSSGESEARTRAWRKLSWIDDPRVIPYFKTALASKRGHLISGAITAIAKFDRADVVAAIAAVTKIKAADLSDSHTTAALAQSTVDNLHHTAAASLSRNKHVSAWPALLRMSGDSYYAVRLTVLHELGKRKTVDATRRIKAMLEDDHETIRSEARRYLRERSIK